MSSHFDAVKSAGSSQISSVFRVKSVSSFHPDTKKSLRLQGYAMKITPIKIGVLLVGEDGFGPSKLKSNRFTVCPLWPLGNSPMIFFNRQLPTKWSWWTDSNPRPADYKSAALPTELHQHLLHGISYRRDACLSIISGNGRGDRTRTCGILVPNQALYQTELRLGFYGPSVRSASEIIKSDSFYILSHIIRIVNIFCKKL